MSRITIVEDEPKLAALLDDYLQAAGYQTVLFDNGTEALDALLVDPGDLVLLDLMLPGTDGMTICKELRTQSNVPIIMLTARVEEIDRLLGLELGADDYVCKPFSPREVIARVKTVLRRTTSEPVAKVQGSGLVIDEDSAQLQLNGQQCSLTSVELNLVKTLVGSPGRIFNREQLMRHMYQDNRIVSDRTIDSHVKKLRQKVESLDNESQYIHSVYGIGYKYEPA